MRRAVILGVLALAASVALAGETYLGTVVATPPTGGTNFYADGGGFFVPRNQKLSLWCTTAAFALTDGLQGRDVPVLNDGGVLPIIIPLVFPDGGTLLGDGGVLDGGQVSTGSPGVPVVAATLFPTSTGVASYRLGLDGGPESPANGGGLVRASGTSSTVCHVYQRLGTE